MSNRKIKIGLVGHSYSRGNFGLCALAFGEQLAIEKACAEVGVDYEIISFEAGINDPCNDSPKVTIEEIDLRNVFKTARQLSKCDLIFDITGGDSFSDIYGVKLFVVNYMIKIAVMLSGVPYIAAPQTYGPFYKGWIRMLSNFYLSKAKGIYGRDEKSGKALTKENINRMKSVADLGFAMPYAIVPKRQQFTVGLNVNGLLYQSNEILGNDCAYKELCHEMIELLKEKGYEVLLIPHVLNENKTIDNDYHVSVQLSAEYGLEKPAFLKNPKDVKSLISSCHFFIGSRMHATIGAVSSGVPTLPLAYSRKFEGVFDSIGYKRTLDLKRASNQVILSAISTMTDKDYDKVKADVMRANQIVSEKMNIYITEISSILQTI